MKKCLALAATAAFLASMIGAAHSYPYLHPQSERVPSCKYRTSDGYSGRHFSVDEIRWTVKCFVRRWPVPGGAHEAICIAERESGLRTWAKNAYSSASGIYQFVSSTWSSLRSRFHSMIEHQRMALSIWNGRVNVGVAIRTAHGSGWGPWGGGC